MAAMMTAPAHGDTALRADLSDELDDLAALLDGVLDRWTEAAAPHLAGAELVWHRQEVAALRAQLAEAVERVRVTAFDLRAAAWEAAQAAPGAHPWR